MARRDEREEEFDYGSVPKRGQLFEKGYYLEEFEDPKEDATDDGRKTFRVQARIVDFGTKTDTVDGMPVYYTFYVGTEDDPDAADPKTWADRQNYGARDMIELLTAAKLVKGDRGAPPWKLFADLDGRKAIDFMSSYIAKKGAKKGESVQTHQFYQEGDRKPGPVGEDDGGKKGGKREVAVVDEEPPKRKREAEVVDEEPPRRAKAAEVTDEEPPRRRRAADEEEVETPRRRRA